MFRTKFNKTMRDSMDWQMSGTRDLMVNTSYRSSDDFTTSLVRLLFANSSLTNVKPLLPVPLTSREIQIRQTLPITGKQTRTHLRPHPVQRNAYVKYVKCVAFLPRSNLSPNEICRYFKRQNYHERLYNLVAGDITSFDFVPLIITTKLLIIWNNNNCTITKIEIII